MRASFATIVSSQGRERRSLAEAAERAPGAHARLLHDVLCLGGVAAHEVRGSECDLLMLLHEVLERAHVATPRRRDAVVGFRWTALHHTTSTPRAGAGFRGGRPLARDRHRSMPSPLLLAALALVPSGQVELLPDLISALPTRLAVQKSGGRQLLVFASAAENVGDGPLIVDGKRTSRSQPSMTATQVVRTADGEAVRYGVADRIRYVVSATHQHWHLLDFARFRLLDSNNRRRSPQDAITRRGSASATATAASSPTACPRPPRARSTRAIAACAAASCWGCARASRSDTATTTCLPRRASRSMSPVFIRHLRARARGESQPQPARARLRQQRLRDAYPAAPHGLGLRGEGAHTLPRQDHVPGLRADGRDVLETTIRPRGPYSLRGSLAAASDCTRRFADGALLVAFDAAGAPARAAVRELPDGRLAIRLEAPALESAHDRLRWLLAVDVDVTPFLALARQDTLLRECVPGREGRRPCGWARSRTRCCARWQASSSPRARRARSRAR